MSLLPLLGGLLVGLSYLPGPLLPLNLAGFLPLLYWIDARRESTAYERLKAGLAFGLVTHLVALHFMYSMLQWSWLAGLLYIGMAAALAARISLSVVLMGWLRRRTQLSWALVLPSSWLPFEWAESWGDLRLTGEHLAHTVAGHPFLVQFADLVGPYGVGAFLLAANGLIFEAAFARRRRAMLALASLLGVVLGYDAWAWMREGAGRPTLRVALVPPNIPLDVKHAVNTLEAQWTTLVTLTLRAAESEPDLIVWPESARPLPLYHDVGDPATWRMTEVQALARRVGIPILVGAEYVRYGASEARRLYNAVFVVDRDGTLLEPWSAKTYLVPFVEATPFASLVGPWVRDRGGEWDWLAGTFTPGPRDVIFPVAATRVGALVCYEQLFADLARGLRNAGAELEVVITNDAWFGRSLFQAYQANAVRLRAIENRTAFVRVANTGISGFVDPRGVYHRQTKLFEETVEVWDVPRAARRTVYDRLGDFVAWLSIGGLAAALAAAWRGTPPAGHG